MEAVTKTLLRTVSLEVESMTPWLVIRGQNRPAQRSVMITLAVDGRRPTASTHVLLLAEKVSREDSMFFFSTTLETTLNFYFMHLKDRFRYRYVCKKFDTEEVLDQEYCRGIRMPREESRKCFKECDVSLSIF